MSAPSPSRPPLAPLPSSGSPRPRRSSVLELSSSALRVNLAFIRDEIGPDVKLCSVIKGNAYGHGIETFVPMAEALGVDLFAVFDAWEAARVLVCKRPATEVLVFGQLDPEDLDWAIGNDLQFYVFDLERLRAAEAAAGRVGRPARLHLEVETGLNRTGLNAGQLDTAIGTIAAAPDRFVVEGLCTHYAGAESVSNYLRIQRQIAMFDELVRLARQRGLEPRRLHTACSAAALTYPETVMDMVRIGILQYGFWPSEETRIHYLTRTGRMGERLLHRMLTWRSRVMGVKHVDTGEFIGYGTSYLASHDTVIATVPVGYSHGFARSLSNHGRVLVNGRRVAVIGVVNMNLMIIDVTGCEVAPGDEVVLIGEQGECAVSVASFSEMSNQLNYELLTRLPRDLPRLVVP